MPIIFHWVAVKSTGPPETNINATSPTPSAVGECHYNRLVQLEKQCVLWTEYSCRSGAWRTQQGQRALPWPATLSTQKNYSIDLL